MEMAKKALAKKYRFSEESLKILEWARGRRAELHYLYPEKKLLWASELAKTRSRLWSVVDEEFSYFHLFPHPVSAAKAFQVFFETAHYEDGGAETYPTLLVPAAFEVEAWDARRLRKDDEVLEEMREGWYYGGWPFKEKIRPKVTLFAIAWFTKD